MNRNYIKSILNNTNMINTISKNKTLCGHHMSEFYFFRIFIESLYTQEINVTVEHEIVPSWGYKYTSEEDFKVRKIIRFRKGSDEFQVSFDQTLLEEKIKYYNSRLKNMGFMESTMALIEIFLDLLG